MLGRGALPTPCHHAAKRGVKLAVGAHLEAAPSLTDTDKVQVALWYPAEHPARGCQGRHRRGEGSSAARPDSCRPLRWPRLLPPTCRLAGAAATDPRDITLLSRQGPSSQSVCLSPQSNLTHPSVPRHTWDAQQPSQFGFALRLCHPPTQATSLQAPRTCSQHPAQLHEALGVLQRAGADQAVPTSPALPPTKPKRICH